VPLAPVVEPAAVRLDLADQAVGLDPLDPHRKLHPPVGAAALLEYESGLPLAAAPRHEPLHDVEHQGVERARHVVGRGQADDRLMSSVYGLDERPGHRHQAVSLDGRAVLKECRVVEEYHRH
jgi:hypothetical protein